MLVVLAALLLAFIAGVALQRGGICAVLATHELVEKRDARRFLAFAECAAWSLLVLLICAALGVMSLGDWPDYRPGWGAIFGGAVFGIGATLNGACAFGSIGRLTGGELSFLALIPGLFLGALVPEMWRLPPMGEMTLSPLTNPVVVLIAGTLVVMFALWRASGAIRLNNWHRAAAAPDWHPALALAVIGIVNVLLVLLVASWPYTALIADAASGRGMEWSLRIALIAFFLAGGIAGATTARRFVLRSPKAVDILRRLAAGVLMGLGAGMIPGGNDSLLLLGLPLLLPFALAAYAAMVAAIALCLLLRRRLMRGRQAA